MKIPAATLAMGSAIGAALGGRENLTKLEAPHDDEDDDDDRTDGVVAAVAEPVFELAVVARSAADTLRNRAVLAAVEERPDEVDTDGDDQECVCRHGVGVKADRAGPARDGAEKPEGDMRRHKRM